MDPVAALERISYLLDRAGESSRRSLAYRNAADTIRAMPPEELIELHTSGRLTSLAGIGDSTANAIAQALDGDTPERLVELEATTAIPVGQGAALRAQISGDCHSHSTWSDGGAPILTMAIAARALGHQYLVMTDHSPRLTVAHGLSRERLHQQLAEIADLNVELAPFRILTGIEVDILEDGTLDHHDDVLAGLDIVVASVHSKLGMDERAMTERIVRAVANPNVDILGHCTGRILPAALRADSLAGRPVDEPLRGLDKPKSTRASGARPRSNFDAEIVFAACARFDTAVEINCRVERQDPPPDLLDLAIEYGCRFSIDTDSHAPGQLEWVSYGCDKAARSSIQADRVVNTFTADDLLAWAGSHPG